MLWKESIKAPVKNIQGDAAIHFNMRKRKKSYYSQMKLGRRKRFAEETNSI